MELDSSAPIEFRHDVPLLDTGYNDALCNVLNIARSPETNGKQRRANAVLGTKARVLELRKLRDM